jgi:hypothetical protein
MAMIMKKEDFTSDIIESIETIIPILEKDEYKKILKFFWFINPHITNYIVDYYSLNSDIGHKLDVGGGTMTPFPHSTHIIDIKQDLERNIYSVDLDYEIFPFTDDYFQFVMSRHTLEDLQNPALAFNEMIRVSKRGIIETPSPMAETTIGVDGSEVLRGYNHHRYLVWTDSETNTLYFLPKYPIIQSLMFYNNFDKKMNYILNHYPVYWNNFYMWDEQHKPNIKVLRHGIDFNILTDYSSIVYNAIQKSFQHTNNFLKTVMKK